MVPSFIDGSLVDQSLCDSIVSSVRANGYDVLLVYRKIGPWFNLKTPTLFKTGDILT